MKIILKMLNMQTNYYLKLELFTGTLNSPKNKVLLAHAAPYGCG